MAGKRRGNGEGNLYLREDGLWVARGTVHPGARTAKRVKVYGKTRQEAHAKLMELLDRDRAGRPVSTSDRTVSDYLDYWLETIVRRTMKDRTQEFYESAVRLYLKPTLGRRKLRTLNVHDAQTAVNEILSGGHSVRTAQKVKQTLRTALSHAEREEIIDRNVAKHILLPSYSRKPIVPWTLQEQQTFVQHAIGHQWFAAYLLLLNYGLRRGEVLGIRWSDIDFEQGVLRVNQQLQRIKGKGLVTGTVKTSAGQRVLPLTPAARAALGQLVSGRPVPSDEETLIFRATTGTPVDPKNFVRAFHRIHERAGLRFITVHHVRHSAATSMKTLGADAKEAQTILGHAHVSTTQQIYQHADPIAQALVLGRIGAALDSPTGPTKGPEKGPDVADRDDDGQNPPAPPPLSHAFTIETHSSVMRLLSRVSGVQVPARPPRIQAFPTGVADPKHDETEAIPLDAGGQPNTDTNGPIGPAKGPVLRSCCEYASGLEAQIEDLTEQLDAHRRDEGQNHAA